MRFLVSFVTTFLFFGFSGASLAHTEESTIQQATTDRKLGPGDKGYKHFELHEAYQKLYSSGKCNCKTGECRPTKYRLNAKSSSGADVLVDGVWYPAPIEALRPPKAVPEELWRDDAHVCAFITQQGMVIECVIINIPT